MTRSHAVAKADRLFPVPNFHYYYPMTKLPWPTVPLFALTWVTPPACWTMQAAPIHVVIQGEALHQGRIDPKLFGNFIELLDDVVPSIWAEMLNDRSFEGVIPQTNWCYFDGTPNICDRAWDQNGTWSLDSDNAFNGARSARLNATRSIPASLTQSNLAIQAEG